jgi:histone demethylase
LSRCCKIDINHGEGDCIWTIVDNKYIFDIQQIILKTKGVDILKEHVVPDNMLLILNQIPIKRVIQKAGSLIFIQAGMLFWR